MNQFRKRSLTISILALFVVAASISVALAVSSGPPKDDADTYSLGAGTNDYRLRVQAGTLNCSASRTRMAFVKWPLTAVSQPVDNATLTFGVESVALNAAPAGGQYVVLYSTTSQPAGSALGDGWTETSVTWANQPGLAPYDASVASAELDREVVPSTSPYGDVVFNSRSLVNYLNHERVGDGIASFALALDGNCGESTVTIRLYSKDQTVSTNPKPELVMRSSPNAVDVSKAGAQQATAWPLYAGLGAVALFVVAGVVITRRRMA